jgi:hypothetical protein
MARRLESKAAAARRARVEFDGYCDSIGLTENETGAVTGFSPNTLKGWRLAGSTKGPVPTYMHGMVRYTAGEIRRWRTAQAHEGPHSPKPKTHEIETA